MWLIVAVPTVVMAIVLIIRRWNAFYNESLMLWSTYPFLPLLAASYLQTVFFETLPRSLMMGICCRKFGGRVRKFGLEYGKWVLPTVSFSTDIGESMVLMTSRGRWTLIVTGVLVPFVLGALYVLGWADGKPRQSSLSVLDVDGCALGANDRFPMQRVFAKRHHSLGFSVGRRRLAASQPRLE